jgi:hypothetical protein
MGSPIKSSAPGTVAFAGQKGGYGNAIIVNHGGGMSTLYGHLSAIDVQRGQPVEAGQQIGKMGSTGHSSGSHLHFEIRKGDEKINPASFIPSLNTSGSVKSGDQGIDTAYSLSGSSGDVGSYTPGASGPGGVPGAPEGPVEQTQPTAADLYWTRGGAERDAEIQSAILGARGDIVARGGTIGSERIDIGRNVSESPDSITNDTNSSRDRDTYRRQNEESNNLLMSLIKELLSATKKSGKSSDKGQLRHLDSIPIAADDLQLNSLNGSLDF